MEKVSELSCFPLEAFGCMGAQVEALNEGFEPRLGVGEQPAGTLKQVSPECRTGLVVGAESRQQLEATGETWGQRL